MAVRFVKIGCFLSPGDLSNLERDWAKKCLDAHEPINSPFYATGRMEPRLNPKVLNYKSAQDFLSAMETEKKLSPRSSDKVITVNTGDERHQGLFYLEKDEVTLEGCVIHVQSSWSGLFQVTYYDHEEKKIKLKSYQGGDGVWTYVMINPDADDLAMEIYCAYQRGIQYKSNLDEAQSRWERLLRYNQTPQQGSLVKVVKGTKIPKGTVGTVFWTNPRSDRRRRIGIRLSETKIRVERDLPKGFNECPPVYHWTDAAWVWAHQVVVLNPKTGKPYA